MISGCIIKEVNMKVSPINNVMMNSKLSFKGQYEPANAENLKESKLWHKNSSIDKTLNSYHSDVKGMAYYAAPMEYVPDSIKENVDFVVYDNEPSYPDLKEFEENYLGNKRKNLREDIEEIREYYYRREMGGHANVDEAKYQQWQAAECQGYYDKAGDARYRKELLEDEIDILHKNVETKNSQLVNNKAKLNSERQLKKSISETISELTNKENAYGQLKTTLDASSEQNAEENAFVNSKIQALQKKLETENLKLQKCLERIARIKQAIAELPERINELTDLITKKTAQRERIISFELKPHLEALKNFYTKQNIKKVIK